MKIVRPVEITRIGDVRYVPGPLIASPSGWLAAAASSSVLGLKLNFASTATVDGGARDHQHHGLDDLHPGRRQHAAEDDVDDHEDAADQHRTGKLIPASASITAPAPTNWATR